MEKRLAKDFRFSLVSTTFNEAKRIRQTIADLEAQTLKPSEIIIVDAGSRDGTWEILNEWQRQSAVPVTLRQDVGCNVAEGRNAAISLATTDLIASTDFGCRFHPEWLESIIEPFLKDEKVEVVGGAFKVRDEEVTNLAQRSDYILQNGYQVKLDDGFSVSSRSIAYKKHVWEKIGGYPEWLTLAADDTIFWRQVRRHGFHYQLVDRPYVYWLRHKTFKAFAKEAGRYGLGDGESGINMRTFISHVIETSLRYSLFLNLMALPFYIPYTFFPSLLLIPALVGLRSYLNAIRKWMTWRKRGFGVSDLIACFWMIELSRLFYIRGYFNGLTRRDREQKEASRKLMQEIS